VQVPEPKPLDQYLRELYAAKEERRRRDAALPFEEKVEIVLELQEASRLMRAGASQALLTRRNDTSAGAPKSRS
jgi:hypothetical protein